MAARAVPRRLYLAIFGALMGFTALTVWAAFIDLGRLNMAVAMTIAAAKAALVVLYFMHVRYSSRLIWVVVGAGFVWLIILISLTMSDYRTREAPVTPAWRAAIQDKLKL